MTRHTDPRRLRMEISILFLIAIFFPSLLLSYFGYIAIKQDQLVLNKLFEERHLQLADRLIDRLQRDVHALEQGAVDGIDLGRIDPSDSQAVAALSEELEKRKRHHEIVKEYFLLDRNLKHYIPDIHPPYLPGDDEQPGERDDLGALLDRAYKADRSEKSLKEAIRVFEERKELEDFYRRGLQREFADGDPSYALGLYRVVTERAASERLRYQALFSMARCYATMRKHARALEIYQELEAKSKDRRAESGLSLAPSAMLQRAKIYEEMGENGNALLVLMRLYGDLLRNAFGLHRPEYIYFSRKAKARIRLLLSRRRDDPMRREFEKLRAMEEATLKMLAYREEFNTALLPDLKPVFRNPNLQSGRFAHLLKIGGTSALLYYRYVPGKTGENLSPRGGENLSRGPLVFGFQLDLDYLKRQVLIPALQEMHRESLSGPFESEGAEDQGVHAALCDRRGRILVASGPVRAKNFSVAKDMEEIFPFWKVKIYYADTRAVEVLSRRRVIRYMGIIALSIGAIILGAFFTLRSVTKSLALARLRSEFVSNVSHELKTPLTSIRMFAETLRLGRAKSTEKQQEYYEIIAHEAERLTKLIDNVLDFAKVEEGKKIYRFEREQPAEILRHTLEIFDYQIMNKGITVESHIPEVLPEVMADRDALSGAIMNLLGNAVKYSGKSREIRIEARPVDEGVLISVTDRGVGIEPEELKRIFDKFYRSKDDITREVTGSGLGLTLVRHITKAHGGRITVKSEKQKGSTFSIWLPAAG
jgi:signal transduction histidine kinase